MGEVAPSLHTKEGVLGGEGGGVARGYRFREKEQQDFLSFESPRRIQVRVTELG